MTRQDPDRNTINLDTVQLYREQIGELDILGSNPMELHDLIKEVFRDHCYYFETESHFIKYRWQIHYIRIYVDKP